MLLEVSLRKGSAENVPQVKRFYCKPQIYILILSDEIGS